MFSLHIRKLIYRTFPLGKFIDTLSFVPFSFQRGSCFSQQPPNIFEITQKVENICPNILRMYIGSRMIPQPSGSSSTTVCSPNINCYNSCQFFFSIRACFPVLSLWGRCSWKFPEIRCIIHQNVGKLAYFYSTFCLINNISFLFGRNLCCIIR